MKVNNKIKEIEKELLTMRGSDFLKEKDFKGKIIDEFPEIIMKKLLPLGIKKSFEAGQKQFQEEIKELQGELKEAIDFQIRDQKILQDLTKKRILECCKENLSNLDGIKWIIANFKDVEKYDYARYILEKLDIDKIIKKRFGEIGE